MTGDGGFDLAELDAVAAHLDLEVEAPQVLERAVIAPAGAVAGAVERGPGGGAERVRDEALGGELGPVPVAQRDPIAPDAQLAGHADRAQVLALVEDVDRGVGDRLADGDPVGGVGNAGAGGPHRGLGGAVHVPQLDTAREQLVGQILGQGFAADQGLERGLAAVQPASSSRRQVTGVACMTVARCCSRRALEGMAIDGLIAAGDHDRGPERERQLQLEHRDVEGQRGDGHEHVIGSQGRARAPCW